MWYHFSKDVNTFGIDNQHMVGEAILVHPVVQHGATSVNLYLPKGVWYHMATFEVCQRFENLYLKIIY